MDIRSLPARRAVGLAAVTLLALSSAACGVERTEKKDDAESSAATSPSQSASSSQSASPTQSASSTTCTYTPDGSSSQAKLPSAKAPAAGDVKANMDTSVGDFNLTLDAAEAPCTVHSFVSLAEQGYFNGTTCHRLVTEGIYVLQCGDPTATGTGGPGYRFADELTGDESYPKGTLAMANSGADTNGSQFFIVYDDTDLPPNFTVFGTVDAETLKRIAKVAAAGNADDGIAPATKVDLKKVTIG